MKKRVYCFKEDYMTKIVGVLEQMKMPKMVHWVESRSISKFKIGKLSRPERIRKLMNDY